ncbi:MAG TPA: GNAT family N-acetyltransferase [Kofleriaceae bacterium]|nr:GNAT family N-acetyltransferase [Kofleriaceae bacterium]
MFALVAAAPADLPELLPRTRALNDHEAISIADAQLEAALRRLLGEPGLGRAWLVTDAGRPIGYAIVTFGYDLEFGGRDAYLTELWIDEPARGRGAGSAALELVLRELPALGVRAIHLQVRPENPAVALYQRAGFARSPRWLMTRRLDGEQ